MPASEEVEIVEQPATPDSLNPDAAAVGVNGDGAPAEEQPPEPDAEQLQSDLAEALRERDAAVDSRARAQAEFENIRKRLQREKDDVVRYAASETIHSLLPVVDDIEKAIGAEGVPPEHRKGLELIRKKMFDVFTRAGLKEVSQHDTFDPNLHFAVDRAPASEEQEDQQILDVYQKGYFFKDRLLRPSMVKVAHKE